MSELQEPSTPELSTIPQDILRRTSDRGGATLTLTSVLMLTLGMIMENQAAFTEMLYGWGLPATTVSSILQTLGFAVLIVAGVTRGRVAAETTR
jgi:hypothetical protein